MYPTDPADRAIYDRNKEKIKESKENHQEFKEKSKRKIGEERERKRNETRGIFENNGKNGRSQNILSELIKIMFLSNMTN